MTPQPPDRPPTPGDPDPPGDNRTDSDRPETERSGTDRPGKALLERLRSTALRFRRWAAPLLATALAWLHRTSQRLRRRAEPALRPALDRSRAAARRSRRWADPVLAPATAWLSRRWERVEPKLRPALNWLRKAAEPDAPRPRVSSDGPHVSGNLHRVHPRMRLMQVGTATVAVGLLATLVGNPGAPSDQDVTLASAKSSLSSETSGEIHEWAERSSSSTGVPVPALESYAHAEHALQRKEPGCGLPWNVLAGIGRVESRHGNFGGSTLTPQGNTSEPIIGIALDGSGVDTVTDTDDGRLDGDTVHDRAVGPMQFIPSTWQTWATDGDGDGKADPQSMDDSAATAGHYLCGSVPSGDLSTRSDQTRALMSYNQSSSYGQMVLEFAEQYEGSVPPPSPVEE